MSDFQFSTSVSRDEVASALENNSEQAAYVLAEFADRTFQTMGRDDMLDCLEGLADHHKEALVAMCLQILGRIGSDNE